MQATPKTFKLSEGSVTLNCSKITSSRVLCSFEIGTIEDIFNFRRYRFGNALQTTLENLESDSSFCNFRGMIPDSVMAKVWMKLLKASPSLTKGAKCTLSLLQLHTDNGIFIKFTISKVESFLEFCVEDLHEEFAVFANKCKNIGTANEIAIRTENLKKSGKLRYVKGYYINSLRLIPTNPNEEKDDIVKFIKEKLRNEGCEDSLNLFFDMYGVCYKYNSSKDILIKVNLEKLYNKEEVLNMIYESLINHFYRLSPNKRSMNLTINENVMTILEQFTNNVDFCYDTHYMNGYIRHSSLPTFSKEFINYLSENYPELEVIRNTSNWTIKNIPKRKPKVAADRVGAEVSRVVAECSSVTNETRDDTPRYPTSKINPNLPRQWKTTTASVWVNEKEELTLKNFTKQIKKKLIVKAFSIGIRAFAKIAEGLKE